MGMTTVYDELTVLEALCTQIGTATGLKTYKLPSPSLQTPCAVPMLEPQWNAGFGGTVATPIQCDILVLVNAGDMKSGPAVLYEYTSGTGSRSVKVALETDRTLGGVIADLRVVGVVGRTYERYDMDSGAFYVGRYIRCEVYP